MESSVLGTNLFSEFLGLFNRRRSPDGDYLMPYIVDITVRWIRQEVLEVTFE